MRAGVIISRDQLESWAGRTLSDEEVARIGDALPHSSVPESVGTIAENMIIDEVAAEREQAEEQGRLPRVAAEAARQVVIDYFREWCYTEAGVLRPERELPRLFEPGHNGTGWDLTWEGSSPDEWTLLVTGGARDRDTGQHRSPAQFPPEVFAEPINHVELGLYPR
jgi:hypothetical protein